MARAGAVLAAGGVIAFPTDTVFGLGARTDRPAGLARVLAIKGRPAGRGMPILIGDARAAGDLAELPDGFLALTESFWPGPLTVLLPAKPNLDATLAPDGIVGLRVPDHPLLRSLLKQIPAGITGTSANRTGHPPLTGAEAVATEFGREIDLVIEGCCRLGEASTVVDLTVAPARLIRAGAISPAQLRRAWPQSAFGAAR